MWRKVEVATVLDPWLSLHPDPIVSCGRGGEALVLAILDGSQVLYKVGQRREERGMVPRLQAGLQHESLKDYRLGQLVDTLCATNLHQGFHVLARTALPV
jgi:hypothetical protein